MLNMKTLKLLAKLPYRRKREVIVLNKSTYATDARIAVQIASSFSDQPIAIRSESITRIADNPIGELSQENGRVIWQTQTGDRISLSVDTSVDPEAFIKRMEAFFNESRDTFEIWISPKVLEFLVKLAKSQGSESITFRFSGPETSFEAEIDSEVKAVAMPMAPPNC